MLTSRLFHRDETELRGRVASLILVMNAFVWYLYAWNILRAITGADRSDFIGNTTVLTINFLATAVSALIGAIIANKIGKRNNFLLLWMAIGIVSSFIPIFLDTTVKTNLYFMVFLFGVSFGLGMPASMGFFADSTSIKNRASTGGIIFFTIGLSAFVLGMLDVADLTSRLVILTLWRGLGTLTFALTKPSENVPMKATSYVSILRQHSFLLYFIPWTMFCLINQTSAPKIFEFFGEGFTTTFIAIESSLAGIVAVISGILCDRIGRRRVAIFGFVMLGVGYAVLGIFPESSAHVPNPLSMYFYTVADGIAWGVFYAVFLTTIWGDLAEGKPSEKYYALGGLPYLLSNFLRFAFGSLIIQTIQSIYALFSLASFFLFLAVIPLMYAPETLPEKHIKDRELKIYVEKAMKVKEKYV